MQTLKEEYNKLLEREKKAAQYLDDNTKPIAEREKWIPQYKNIIDRLGAIIDELRQLGYKMTDNEIIEGFKGGNT